MHNNLLKNLVSMGYVLAPKWGGGLITYIYVYVYLVLINFT